MALTLIALYTRRISDTDLWNHYHHHHVGLNVLTRSFSCVASAVCYKFCLRAAAAAPMSRRFPFHCSQALVRNLERAPRRAPAAWLERQSRNYSDVAGGSGVQSPGPRNFAH